MTRAKYDLPPGEVQYRMSINETSFNVTRFEVYEALSSPGYLRASVIGFDASLDLSSMLDKRGTLTIHFGTRDDRHSRFYHGVVQSFQLSGTDEAAAYFEVVLVPTIWMLSLRFRSRLHATDKSQNIDVKKVIKNVFKNNDIPEDRIHLQLSRDYQPYNFLTQYNQTDLDFLHSLLEREGITYVVDQRDDVDHYIFTDDTTQLADVKPYNEILVRRSAGAQTDDFETIEHFTFRKQLTYDNIEFRDYDFKNAERRLFQRATGGHEKHPFYIYGPSFQDDRSLPSEEMSRLSKNRFDEFQSNAEEGNGYGDYRCLTAGKMFKPVEAQSRSLNIDWLCTSVHYEGTEHEQVDTDSAGMGAGGVSYRMSFTCIPKSLPYRPPCRTPMPRILGTQTAVVVGPAGEEIHTDKFGRVKIHLHWDRQPKTDKNANEDDINYNDASSFWCRVGQTAAGKSWGIFSLPRIGQEVIVDFINGDPNNPIIVGVMHNDFQTVPYPLPEHKTRTTIKTNSSPGGNGFNEIRFEDKAGKEQIFMHAERNLDIRVKAAAMESIGGNRSLTIGSEKYPADQMERVYGNKDLEVWKQKKERIRQMSELRVDEDYHTNVLKNYSLFVEENANYSTTKDRREIVSGNADFIYVSKRKTKVVQDDLMKVNGKWHVNGGDIVIQGDTAITLVVGGNFIKIDASGVTIVGSMVKINSGGAPGTLTPVGTADGASGRVPVEPKEPTPADNDKTGDKSTLPAPPT